MVDIDTSRTNDAIQEFELRFDSAKAGGYVDATKLASLSTMTDCPLLKEPIRGWVKNGIPIGQGRKVAWRLAKWYGGADALRKYFPPEDSRDQAADDLADFKQRQRADPHVFEWMELRESAGDPVDLGGRLAITSCAAISMRSSGHFQQMTV